MGEKSYVATYRKKQNAIGGLSEIDRKRETQLVPFQKKSCKKHKTTGCYDDINEVTILVRHVTRTNTSIALQSDKREVQCEREPENEQKFQDVTSEEESESKSSNSSEDVDDEDWIYAEASEKMGFHAYYWNIVQINNLSSVTFTDSINSIIRRLPPDTTGVVLSLSWPWNESNDAFTFVPTVERVKMYRESQDDKGVNQGWRQAVTAMITECHRNDEKQFFVGLDFVDCGAIVYLARRGAQAWEVMSLISQEPGDRRSDNLVRCEVILGTEELWWYYPVRTIDGRAQISGNVEVNETAEMDDLAKQSAGL